MSDKENKYFHCKPCRYVWETADYLTAGDTFVATCPICEKSNKVIETSYRVANLALGWDKATGPTTEAGKARTKLNAWQHGRRASQFHIMAPAKPGKYSICADCQYIEECKKEFKFCPLDLETLARFVQAYKEGAVNDLRELAGLAQANLHKIFNEMVHHILTNGVAIEVKKPLFDKDGEILRDDNGKMIFNKSFEKNNLVKDLPAFVQSMGFSAIDQDMTPRTRQESETLKGYIDDKQVEKDTMFELKKRTHDELKKMREALTNMDLIKKIKKFDEQATDSPGDTGGDGNSEVSE